MIDQCGGCHKIEPDRLDRLVLAILETMVDWQDRVAEIERHAIPGNKIRALSLMRDMEMTRVSLRRLAGIEPSTTP